MLTVLILLELAKGAYASEIYKQTAALILKLLPLDREPNTLTSS